MNDGIAVTVLAPLDGDVGVPLYRQIVDQLIAELVDAEEGTRLPSEHAIADHTGVSRATAVHALRELERQGFVERRQGKGTFVAQRPAVRSMGTGSLPSFSDDLRRAGHQTEERLLHVGKEPCPSAVAERLQLSTRQQIWRVERVIYSDGHPVVLVSSLLTVDLYPLLDPVSIEHSSLYEHLEHVYGPAKRPSTADEQWRATHAPRAIAVELEVAARSPVMQVDRIASLADGHLAEYSRSHVRGDAFVVALHVDGGKYANGSGPKLKALSP